MVDDEAVRRLDPLHLDQWFASGPPLSGRTPADVRERLRVAVGAAPGSFTSSAALAALRDLDFLLCVVERHEPRTYQQVVGAEQLLLRLGGDADHLPRGSNHTYGVVNPTGARMRTFTGLDAERELVEALRSGGVGLSTALEALASIAAATDRQVVATAAESLERAWEPMVTSAVTMARRMPLDVFSRDIIPWLVPLEIGGTEWRAPTGAQFSNSLIDWALWGVDVDDSRYVEYAAGFMAETPAAHRALVDVILGATGGRSVLAVTRDRLRELDPPTARAVYDGLQGLLRRMRDFRAVHGRFAAESLDLRASDVGSGGQAEAQFGPLLAYTRDAYSRLLDIGEENGYLDEAPFARRRQHGGGRARPGSLPVG